MTAPRVSVVVPVKNRRDLLARLLDSLEKQTYRDFEVVVVDDGSTDGCPDEVRGRSGAVVPIRLLSSGGRGAVAARQVGIGAAAGEVLAFTDSDCVARPEWLEAATEAIDRGADVVKGRTEPANWPLAPFERSVASYDEGLYPTCNMLYRRSAYERFGGFDEAEGLRLGFRWGRRARGMGFGEDTMLAWRARRGGARVDYVEEAVVEHAVFPPDIRESLSRTVVMGGFPTLLKEVPDLGPQLLRHGFMFGPRNRLPMYVAALLLLTGRWRPATAALAWWAAVRALELRPEPVGRGRKLALVPAEMAMDVGTGAALLAGSIRARKIAI